MISNCFKIALFVTFLFAVHPMPADMWDLLDMDRVASTECTNGDAQSIEFGRNLTVFVKNNTPFTSYDDHWKFYKGIEVDLVETIAQRLNFNIVYTYSNNKNRKTQESIQMRYIIHFGHFFYKK